LESTTGFDDTVDTIILNRATKSLTLYYQMIGRGSRKLPNKDMFTVIDLGNNAAIWFVERACELATYLQITRILFRKLTG
jgi:type I site-specific restriction endonuclease